MKFPLLYITVCLLLLASCNTVPITGRKQLKLIYLKIILPKSLKILNGSSIPSVRTWSMPAVCRAVRLSFIQDCCR